MRSVHARQRSHSVGLVREAERAESDEWASQRLWDSDVSPPAPTTFWAYLWNELTSGYFSKEGEEELVLKQEEVMNFLSVPWQLERFLYFSFLICVDAFLFIFAFLPVRIAVAVGAVLRALVTRSAHAMKPTHQFDLLRGGILMLGFLLLHSLDSSRIYHWIRAQSVLKLYVIFNILEIFDKLCCSFGQDILDSLFATLSQRYSAAHGRARPSATSALTSLSLYLQVVVALCYVCVHELFLFIKVITLNVAVNSYDNAVLALLVSNQFVELKSAVFKNFKEQNVFQIACSDAVERFQIVLSLFIVIAYNFHDTRWNVSGAIVAHVAWYSALVVLSEFLVDWVKHAFIIKFNQIAPVVYKKFTTILATDIAHRSDTTARLLDSSHLVARRLGFVPIPLAALMLRVLVRLLPLHGLYTVLIVLLLWANVVALKMLVRLTLLEKALRRLQSRWKVNIQTLSTVHRFTRIVPSQPAPSPPLSPKEIGLAHSMPPESAIPLTAVEHAHSLPSRLTPHSSEHTASEKL